MSEPEAKLTAYQQRRRETCQWCAKDLDRYVGEGVPYHRDNREVYVGQCTAPTESQFGEEMADEARKARALCGQLFQTEHAVAGAFVKVCPKDTYVDGKQAAEHIVRLAVQYQHERDQWRAKFDSEHALRIKYQDIAYMVCHFLDVALGNSAKRGTCLLAEKDAIHLALVRLFHSQHQPEEPNVKR